MSKIISLDSFRRLIVDPLKTLIDKKPETWDDLKNKPNVLVYDAQVLTEIQQKQARTNIGVPSDSLATEVYVNDLIAKYEENDPTVPDWAKAETKPTYTAEEVGADPSNTAATLIAMHNIATNSHEDIRNAINSITPASIGAATTSHSQSANTITAGTFAGQVVANASVQTPSIALLRNSKLVTTETNPINNGEICWMYE